MSVTRTRAVLNLAGVEAVAAAAREAADAKGFRVVYAVVDAWGRLQHLGRTAGAQPASDQVAIDKARTAAIFVRPSRELEAQVSSGRLGALALHGAAALTGGIPIVIDGEVVGAVGTSGETPDEDESVSIAAAGVADGSVADGEGSLAGGVSTQAVRALTRAGAQQVAEAVGALATARGVSPVVAVVDAGGELLHLWRPDGAQVASVGVATDKARTAALYRRPSKDFEDQAATGRASALHLAGAVPLQGGFPLVVDGDVVGAVGVSGASSAPEDSELALAGTRALDDLLEAAASAPTERSATFVSAAELAERFATGGVFVRADGFAVDAGRRSAPGEAEWHERVADVMHVVAGSATVMVGGDLVDARDVAPGERRAAGLRGGSTHTLTPGDVLVVPAGVPHQFTSVSGQLHYLVTKVGE